MNLESVASPKKNAPAVVDLDLEDFDFKPITSGLGFSHQQKTTTEIKPAFVERAIPTVRDIPVSRPQAQQTKKEMNVYQNDLSLFYGQTEQVVTPSAMPEEKPEKVYRLGSKMDRIVAYVLDMGLLSGIITIMLMAMSKATGMEIMDAWAQYPDEITPLVATLTCGFYLLYFSIFEKSGATFGKSMMNLRVVNAEDKRQNFMTLLVRSLITLANFASLGLFSYFDLQNKATGSKVIKAE